MEQEIQPQKNIAIYGRVSTAHQEEENTIETQLSAVREYAKKHNLNIVKEYIDNGWSGDSIVRPSLDQLRLDAKSKLWQAVLIYDPDRLARRYSYQELVMDELRDGGTEVMFVTTAAPKNSEDKILYGVKGLFAEYERAKIAERFRLGKMRKARDGHIMMSVAPFGYTLYKRSENKQTHCVINEEDAEMVRKMFSWVGNDGLSVRGVIKRLQDLGIKSRRSKTGLWCTSTMSQLFKNKAYIGETRFASTYRILPKNPFKQEKYKKHKKTSAVKRPESEWIKIPFPRIIDDELFYKVQEKLKNNSKMRIRCQDEKYLMAGKLWCSCGYRRCGKGSNLPTRSSYYTCNQYFNVFPLKSTCTQRAFNKQVADDMVWGKLTEVLTSTEFLTKQVEGWLERRKQIPSVKNTEDEKKQIAKLKEQEARFITAYGSGAITVEQLKEHTTSIKEKIAFLEDIIEKANSQAIEKGSMVVPTKDQIAEFVEKAKVSLAKVDPKTKKMIFNAVVDKVVGSEDRLSITGYIPLNPSFFLDNCRTENYPYRQSELNATIKFEEIINLPPIVPVGKYDRRNRKK